MHGRCSPKMFRTPDPRPARGLLWTDAKVASSGRSGSLLVGLLSSLIAVLTLVGSAAPAFAANANTFFGHNLIVNGNAEANVGSDDETVVVKPSGWQTSGQFGVFKYGGIFGFP